MTADEFRELIRSNDDSQLLGPCLKDDILPYVFEPRPESWELFRGDLVAGLGILPAEIRVVGSGRFGVSMTPGKNLRRFQDKSDIDLIVVNPGLFDFLWHALLDAAYPRSRAINKIGGWLQDRRNEVYTGWLSPLEIRLDLKFFGVKARPVVDFNRQWFNTFKKASRHPPRRHADISGRLYRTWGHAELYTLDSLAALRKSIA